MALAGDAAGQPIDPPKPPDIVLFEEARELMNKEQFAAAAAKLEESQRIKPGLGKLFQLSVCNEKLGRTASAWRGYTAVAQKAEEAGRVDEAGEAKRRAAAVEPLLAKVRVNITPPAAPGLEVTLTGARPGSKAILDSLSWGLDIPVDPDIYTIRASAPTKVEWTSSVTVERPGATIRVTVPPLKNVLPFEGNTTAPAAASSDPRNGPEAAAPSQRRSIVVPLILGGGAAVALGMGIAFTVAWQNKESEVAELQAPIPENGCSSGSAPQVSCDALRDAASSVPALRNTAIGSYIVAGLATGGLLTYLAVTSRPNPSKKAPAAIHVLPWLSSSNGGLVAAGSF